MPNYEWEEKDKAAAQPIAYPWEANDSPKTGYGATGTWEEDPVSSFEGGAAASGSFGTTYPISPSLEQHSDFLAQEEGRDSLLERFGKQYYNVAVAAPAYAIGTESPVGIAKTDIKALGSLEEDVKDRFLKRLPLTQQEAEEYSQPYKKWSIGGLLGLKRPAWQEALRDEYQSGKLNIREPETQEQKINKLQAVLGAARVETSKQADISFAVSEAENWKEWGIDIIAGLTGFVSQLAALKKAFPSAPQVFIWELQNQITGGAPGKGALTYGAFTVPGKAFGVTKALKAGIKPTRAARAATLASESFLLGGMSAVEQKIETGEVKWKDVAVSAFIPVGLRVPAAAKKGMAKLISRAILTNKVSSKVAVKAARDIVAKAKETGIPVENIVGNIEVARQAPKIVSRFPQKITSTSLEPLGNKMKEHMGLEGWKIDWEILPASEKGFLADSKVYSRSRKQARIRVQLPSGKLVHKGQWKPTYETAGQVPRKAGEALRYTQATMKRAIVHELGHIKIPSKVLGGKAKKIGHTKEFADWVNTKVGDLFVERTGKTIPKGEKVEGLRRKETRTGIRKSKTKVIPLRRLVPKKAPSSGLRRRVVQKRTMGIIKKIIGKSPEEVKAVREEKYKQLEEAGANKDWLRSKKIFDRIPTGTKKDRLGKLLKKQEALPVTAKESIILDKKIRRDIGKIQIDITNRRAISAKLVKWIEASKPVKKSWFTRTKSQSKVTPPTSEQITKRDWGLLNKAVFDKYPIAKESVRLQRTNTLNALDNLKTGKIPTNPEFGVLSEFFGRVPTEKIFRSFAEQRTYGLLDIPVLSRDMLKSMFGLDPQVFRQARGVAPRHPKIYKTAAEANVLAYGSNIASLQVARALESSSGYKLSKKYMPYLEISPWRDVKQGTRLQQYGTWTDFLLTRKNKVLKAWGTWLAASERGANVGINTALKQMWDVGERDLAALLKRKPMSASQIDKYRSNRGKDIAAFMKRVTAKNPQTKDIQQAANWILFSPAHTIARPISTLRSIKNLFTGKGVAGRTYAAQLTVSNIASISALSAIGTWIGYKMRANNPTEEPTINSSNNPTDAMWGKIRNGNDVIDLTAGDGAWYRLVSRIGLSAVMWARQKITKEERTKAGGRPIPKPGKEMWRYLKNRETVLLGLAETLATGKDWLGDPIPRWEALARQFPMEFLVSVVDAGNADGLWEGMLEKEYGKAGKAVIDNLYIGIAGITGFGTGTYPVSAATTRYKFKNIVANKAHQKDWDDLTLNQQNRLSRTYNKELDTFAKAIKEEGLKKPRSIERIQEALIKSRIKITKALSKPNQKKLEGTGVSVGVSRSPKNWYLSDSRYQAYQEGVAKYIDEKLSKKDFTGKSESYKVRALELIIGFAKQKALTDVRKQLQRKK